MRQPAQTLQRFPFGKCEAGFEFERLNLVHTVVAHPFLFFRVLARLLMRHEPFLGFFYIVIRKPCASFGV
jgi:hypothetical protein